MNNSEMLIAEYNKIDDFMRRKLHMDKNKSHSSLIVEMFKRRYITESDRDNMLRIAVLRNAIEHNYYKSTGIDPIAEPHEKIIDIYIQICKKITNPPSALESIAVKEIFKASFEDNAISVMMTMKEKSYTNVPVVKNNSLMGIFSESTIFTRFLETNCFLIDENELIEQFEPYIPLDKHSSEYFGFVPRNASIIDVQKRFYDPISDNKKLGAVFITEHGKETEGLLGMVTLWDLLKIK